MVEYDSFAEVFDVWIERAPITDRNGRFYLQEYLNTSGRVVELGVGTGRIAIEAALQGKAIIGVDSSAAMLSLCRERADAAGVANRLTLIQADFRDFVLPERADLITIPWHTIGHLVTLEDKRVAMDRICGQLAPGGRLIFDHFLFDSEAARRHSAAILDAEYRDRTTGRETLLWHIVRYDFDAQTMRFVSWTDELDEDGEVVRRKYRRLTHSWLKPEQTRALLLGAGFEIEALYGNFVRGPFDANATHQVWVARKPR